MPGRGARPPVVPDGTPELVFVALASMADQLPLDQQVLSLVQSRTLQLSALMH